MSDQVFDNNFELWHFPKFFKKEHRYLIKLSENYSFCKRIKAYFACSIYVLSVITSEQYMLLNNLLWSIYSEDVYRYRKKMCIKLQISLISLSFCDNFYRNETLVIIRMDIDFKTFIQFILLILIVPAQYLFTEYFGNSANQRSFAVKKSVCPITRYCFSDLSFIQLCIIFQIYVSVLCHRQKTLPQIYFHGKLGRDGVLNFMVTFMNGTSMVH